MKNQNQFISIVRLTVSVATSIAVFALAGCESPTEDDSEPIYCLYGAQTSEGSSLTMRCAPTPSPPAPGLSSWPILFQEQWVAGNRQWLFWNVTSGRQQIRVGASSNFEIDRDQVLVLSANQLPNLATGSVEVWSETLGLKLGDIKFETKTQFPRGVRGRNFTGTLRNPGGELRVGEPDVIHPTLVSVQESFWIWAQMQGEPLYPEVGDFDVLQVRTRRGPKGEPWVGLELKVKPVYDFYPPTGRLIFGNVNRILVLKKE